MEVGFGVLGPVAAWDASGAPLELRGPRHRAVLARLIVARGHVVGVDRLVDDLWRDPPPDAVGALRTFVAALRRALEPERPPRAPARLLVTEGPGYALRAAPGAVDAWRFEQAVEAAGSLPAPDAAARLGEALDWWRGPAYADFADEPWARTERARLAELRLRAVELRAEAGLATGRAAATVPDLDAHVAEHPWREDGWRLLALALYRSGRQADALAVLRRARTLLVEQLGVEPGPALRRLEQDVLHHADHLLLTTSPSGADDAAGQVWAQAAAAYDRAVTARARARLESTVGLLRTLAVTGGGGLQAARRHRVAAVAAAQELGDPELTARVIGAYDVPAIWTRVDDPPQAAEIVAAAERTLALLAPGAHEAARARLLATIAVESRGERAGDRSRDAAREAEELARRLGDPALLAFALNGAFMQSCHRAGLAPRRDELGAELVELSVRHGLVTYEVLGRLIRIQARSALADFAAADRHATAADALAERHELPLVGVFTRWYRALRLAATDDPRAAEPAYRAAAAALEGAGMPGLQEGLLPLALLSLTVRSESPAGAGDGERGRAEAARADPAVARRGAAPLGLSGPAAAAAPTDYGPYEPWARPLVLLAQERRDEAAAALRAAPDPPPDLLLEALWCLVARAAIELDDRATMERARDALAPAAGELAGAGSGLLTLGPVDDHLAALDAALRDPGPA